MTTLLTENSLANCHFSEEDILQTIRTLASNKTHGHDMISIWMLKLCGNLICKLLEIIFKMCLWNGRFQLQWKKANAVPIHKKGDKLSKTIAQFHEHNQKLVVDKSFKMVTFQRFTIISFWYYISQKLLIRIVKKRNDCGKLFGSFGLNLCINWPL